MLMGLGILPLAMGAAVPAAHAGPHLAAPGGQPASASPCAGDDHHHTTTAGTCDHHAAHCHCPQACQATGVPAQPPRRLTTRADREPSVTRPAPATLGFPSAPWRPPSSRF
ncbi:hypothetical protein [Alloalcanivorax marinus]|uniref:hypothetical protein n=1 Tax=Alloalcanivorax marinus TaxID=1177169 RepID=UPI001959C157|nr:hypothetical protein [Alloalcanivorax marinus]MBM7333094.1 hypothetical protein [Alloalcanivorax marinus]